jgi:hypothetical protein
VAVQRAVQLLSPGGLLVTDPFPFTWTVSLRAWLGVVAVVVSVSVLFAVLGSAVSLEVVAVLLRVVPPAAPDTFTTRVKLAVASAARLVVWQWTVPVPPTAYYGWAVAASDGM